MTAVTSTKQPEGLSRELNGLLVELGLALQRYALYPGGHPSVDTAVAQLARRLEPLLASRELLSLGVARRQLVVEGVATEASHPMLRSVAARLHRHRIGVVAFHRGVTAGELTLALRAISEDPDRSGQRLGQASSDVHAQWPHIRFHSLKYEQLKLAEEAEDGAEGDAVGGAGTSAAELWIGLARAALAQEDWPDEDRDADPEQVAEAINQRHGVQSYDQVIVGFMLQLAEELRVEGGASVTTVRRRVSEVIRRLDPTTLDRLLEMGGDTQQRARFLHHAARGLRADAVIEVLGAAARAEGQDISTSMLRMLRKLSVMTETRDAFVAEQADGHLREQVHNLLVGWSLEDPNPDAYTLALESMSRIANVTEVDATDNDVEPLRLIRMSIEIGVAGTPTVRAVTAALAEGRLAELYATIDAAPTPNPAVDAIWLRIETADHVRRALTTDPIDFGALDRVLARMSTSTVISLLLDRVSESESRATRMGVLGRLVKRGLPVSPQALERLRDPRWYVLRNMLFLLREIGSWPVSFSALPYVKHAHECVRREALRLAVRIPAERDAAVVAALADVDERALRIGINAARESGLPAAGIAVALRRIHDPELSADLVSAILRLMRHDTPAVVAALLEFVLHGRTILGRPRLAPASPVMLAALSSLAAIDPTDPRARAALDLARASGSPVVRKAAGAAAP